MEDCELYLGKRKLSCGDIAEEIDQQTEFGVNWLKANYRTSILLLKRDWPKQG